MALVDAQQRACQEPNPRTAPAGSQQSSAQFALWIHVSAAHRRLEHSVDALDLRHHPEEHLGLLEHCLQDTETPRTERSGPQNAVESSPGEALEDLHEELRPSPAAATAATTPPPPASPHTHLRSHASHNPYVAARYCTGPWVETMQANLLTRQPWRTTPTLHKCNC